MEPLQLWLFERPPVTLTEIEHWAQTHARISADDWRFYYYVNHWCVPEKIAAQKIALRQGPKVNKSLPTWGPRPYPRKLLMREPHRHKE